MADILGPLYDEPAEPPATLRAAPLAPAAIKAARAKLNPIRAPQSVIPLVGAAVLCASAAMALAAAVILGPPHLGPDVTVSKPVAGSVSRPR